VNIAPLYVLVSGTVITILPDMSCPPAKEAWMWQLQCPSLECMRQVLQGNVRYSSPALLLL